MVQSLERNYLSSSAASSHLVLAEAPAGRAIRAEVDPAGSAALNLILLAWLVIALFAAKKAGVFRRRSIVGSERIASDETVWLLVLIFFAGLFFANLLTNAADKIVLPRPAMRPLFLTALIEAAAAPIIIAGSFFSRKQGIGKLGLRIRDLPRGIGAGILTLFILFPMVFEVGDLTGLCMKWMGRPEPKAHEVLQSLAESKDKPLIVLGIVVAIVVAPIFEEIAFRGFLQTMLAQFFRWIFPPRLNILPQDSPAPADFEPGAILAYAPDIPEQPTPPGARWVAICITAAFFAFVHREPAFMPALFVLAVGLGYVYERTGNLWATITTHALFNSAQILIFLTFVPR